MKIELIDYHVDKSKGSEVGGHAFRYCQSLSTLPETNWDPNYRELPAFRDAPIRFFLERRKYLREYVSSEYIHILQLDEFYRDYSLFRKLKRPGHTVMATLHHIPREKWKLNLLRKSSQFISVIVVHSKFLRDILLKKGIKCDVEIVIYPVFLPPGFNSYAHRNADEAENTKKKFLCIGDTRRDKGLNILADAFRFISDGVKNRIHFIIAGRETELKYKDAIDSANEWGISMETHPQFLTDEEYWQYIESCDIILLPYAKDFIGASGPLGDGVYCGKTILSSDCPNLGQSVIENELGKVFESENSYDLAQKITEMAFGKQVHSVKYERFRQNLSEDIFKQNYSRIYKRLMHRAANTEKG